MLGWVGRIIGVLSISVVLCGCALSDTGSPLRTARDGESRRAAQTVIDACHARYKEDQESGVTERMRDAAFKTALCLEEHLMDLAEHALYADDPKLVQETRQNLTAIRKNFGGYYWNLYNSHDGCFKDSPMGCGTFFHPLHNERYTLLLEDMTRDAYWQMYLYDLQEKAKN